VVAFWALLASGCSTNEGAGDTSEETTTTANAPVSLSYVALGDSLAVGLGAYRGYVDRYADYIKTDTGAQVDVVNLGQSGETSSQLLHALRNHEPLRQALSTADVITFNIGFNDLGRASEAYENGTCGGVDNQDCLRAAVGTFEENWDAIIAELLSFRSTDDTIIRTVGLGYTPHVDTDEVLGMSPSYGRVNDFRVFEPYANEANHHIATTATKNGIPYAEVHLDKENISRDGVHPNDEGYETIADQLRELGYSPLGR
jgi:lysophospholipase L1-like esterase